MVQVEIQQELCSNCGACINECPDGGVFIRVDGRTTVSDRDDCLRCWHCISLCPSGAVRHKTIPFAEFAPIDAAELPSRQALTLAFQQRRSSRKFHQRSVPRELVETLVGGARWTPSAHNNQDINWLAFDDPQKIKALADETAGVFRRAGELLRSPLIRALGPLILGKARFQMALENQGGLDALLADHNSTGDAIFYHAPLVLIGHTAAGNDLGRDDAIYQAYNIMLLAERLELGTCQIGYLTFALNLKVMGINRTLQQRLNLPAGRAAQVALVVGYPRTRFRRVTPRRAPGLDWNPSLSQ